MPEHELGTPKPLGLTLFFACALAAWSCGGKPRPVESGWNATRAVADSQIARGAGGVVSPLEASTERLAARTRTTRARPQPPAAASGGAAHMRGHLVRAGLEELKFAEARHFRQRRTYAGDIPSLEYWVVPGTVVRLVWANKWGWAAIAADSLVPAEYCAIYVGSAPDPITSDARRWGKPGEVYCDNRTDAASLGRNVLYGAETPEQTLVRHAMTKMPISLTQLVVGQDAYRKTQYTYSRRVEFIAIQYGWEPGVKVRMLFSSSEGWAAEATYDLLPGRSCVIFGGEVPKRPTTAAEGREPPKERVPVCDDWSEK
ncbi:MAG TPA: hypothetical protein VIE46_03785 [Gemmatimonadales bacterium]